MTKYNFTLPKQVKYWDSDSDHYVGGIAYGDHIICACCGATIPIDEIVDFAPVSVKPIRVFKTWLDLSEEVIGTDPNDFNDDLYESDAEI